MVGEKPGGRRQSRGSRHRSRSRSKSPQNGSRNRGRYSKDDVVRKETIGKDDVQKDQLPVAQKEIALDADLSAEEIQMMVAMGIPFGFDTTQGKHVEDASANQGAVKVATKRSARQYMNRRGGFNKALPAEKTGEKVHIEGYARR